VNYNSIEGAVEKVAIMQFSADRNVCPTCKLNHLHGGAGILACLEQLFSTAPEGLIVWDEMKNT
jgi:hypothetical protein